tara:strand:- start:1371 stop:1802 length:432 start_codon:yes stop_codon:yes gene_type:complete
MAITVYEDFDVDFAKNSFTNDISTKINIEAIRQSLTNLLLTRPGERPFSSSNMGVGLQDLYFELDTDKNMTLLIQDRIRSVINNYDPRVEFKNFKIEKDESVLDGSSIIATIEYAIFGASSNITETSSMTDGIVITIEGPSNG